MNWNPLNQISQLADIDVESQNQTVVIFKHSTRCSISSTALSRIERKWNEAQPLKWYYLDLLQYREISNKLAEHYEVEHQSPQVLLIKSGKCVYTTSHLDIDVDQILKQ